MSAGSATAVGGFEEGWRPAMGQAAAAGVTKRWWR